MTMTTEERLQTLERELGRTTRRNRWLMGALTIVLASSVAGFTQQPTTKPGEVRATKFMLVNEQNEQRAVLGMAAEGPALIMLNKNGKQSTSLAVNNDGPLMMMMDQNGKRRVSLTFLMDRAALTLTDDNGKDRAALVAAKEKVGLRLWDENEKVIWSAP